MSKNLSGNLVFRFRVRTRTQTRMTSLRKNSSKTCFVDSENALRDFAHPTSPMRPVPRQVQVPQRLQRNLVNDRSYAGAFKQFENNSPLENEFNDVKLSANEEKMIDNLVQEFDVPPPPVTSTALQFSKFNPGMFNATVDSGFGQKDTVLDLKNYL